MTWHTDDCEFWHDQYPWECTCHVGATPPPRAFTPEEKAALMATALDMDIRSAAQLLRENGWTVMPPEAGK